MSSTVKNGGLGTHDSQSIHNEYIQRLHRARSLRHFSPIDSSAQRTPLLIDLNRGFIDRDVIRVLSVSWL